MTSQERISRSREPEPPLILIADDEEAIAEMLEAFVTDLGYIPQVAHNGQQALMQARECWPALVLTDLMMPIMSGADLITALSEEAAAHGRASPFMVLLTAGSARAVNHLHVDAILFKPFDLGKLAQVIHRLLGP
jgi:two-component system, chemotaxis family, chemotaxis protein CheY